MRVYGEEYACVRRGICVCTERNMRVYGEEYACVRRGITIFHTALAAMIPW
jgi:hypothetical protein